MPTTREEQAATELGTTEITPGVARALVVAFAVTLITVPLLQWAGELRAYSAKERNTPWPSAADILTAPSVALHGWSQAQGNIGHKTLAANAELLSEIRRFETSLEDDSIVTNNLLGPTRNWLARIAGWGTEEAWIGRDGWLFYRPDLDYSIGPGFLDPKVLARRQRGGLEFSARRHPDPRPAILDFARQLELRNIQLVLVPTPTKAMVHPERFGGQDNTGPLHNRSWPEFVDTLNAANITVFDPLPVLLERRRRDHTDQFLATDTHWRPEAMEAVAEALAVALGQLNSLPNSPTRPTWVRQPREVTGQGELLKMMRLGPDSKLFEPETVTIQQVLSSDLQHWQPDPTAPVLVLGDSYTNIYSYNAMGFGQSAGFAEQLAWHLQRPVDSLARNADGAHATRRQLARETRRLENTRILVWQFAVRELTSGDWPLIPLPAKPRRPTPQTPQTQQDSLKFQCTILATSGVPTPGTVPYRDAVLSLHASGPTGGEFVIFSMGMKDNRLTAASRLKPGDTLTLRLIPWTTVQQKYGRLNRIELDDPDFRLVDLPTYWADPQ